MDLEIENIRVTIEDIEEDEDNIIREVQRHLEKAMECISNKPLPFIPVNMEIKDMDLREIDWESESDRTGKLVELILNELFTPGLSYD